MGLSADWQAKWFNEKNYKEWLLEDEEIRKFIKNRYYHAGISEIYVERPDAERINITVKTARPGIIIGRKGAEITSLREELERKFNRRVVINIEEIKRPNSMHSLLPSL